MSIKINKNGNEYPLGVIPQHYPADRVYLDGDTTKNVQGAIDEVVGKVAFATYNIPNDTSEHTFSCPTGFTADNSCLIGANCNTRYNTKVDYTYNNFSYWGDFRYNRLNTSEFVFAPKIAGNSTSITFIFMKQ